MDTSGITEKLRAGGVGILPTDTIYGLVACALDSKAVERVYEARRRRPEKPCIILIADTADLEKFGIDAGREAAILQKLWPGPVSIVFPCDKSEFVYLHRGTKTLAFRLPQDEKLRALLRETGPLIAPSANPEGMKPATTIAQAKVYFEDRVDFYIDVGERLGAPSTLVEIQNGKVVVLRQGSATIPEELLAG